MSTLEIISLVFFLVWSFTALAFWLERKSRMAKERELNALIMEVANNAAALANNAADISLHTVIKSKIRPFVAAAESTELTGKEKREKALAEFAERHPGIPWEHADRAIEAIVKESRG
jgi:hypothetical protein